MSCFPSPNSAFLIIALATRLSLNAQSTSDSFKYINGLPHYAPIHKVSGLIRNCGSDFAGVVKQWEEGFSTYHPDIRFSDNMASSDTAFGGLEYKVADLAPNGREADLIEYLGYTEVFNHDPLEITVGSGSYDVKGRTWGLVVFVNKDNPLTKITMKQLDGIFGAERTGGYSGYRWMPEAGRSAKDDIRTWGQLGLTGEWADQPIQTYGYASTGMSKFFQLKVFHGGEKWNSNYREYVESGTKQVAASPAGEALSSKQMLKDLARDKFGMAWSGIGHAREVSDLNLKPLALAEGASAIYIEPTKDNFQQRRYPLVRSIFIYLDRTPGTPVDIKFSEFLRYVLSFEGQAALEKSGSYLPLPAEEIAAQLKKLD